ncbi:MAG: asparagine synthetase B family protein [Gelidibacter sp.]|nr:asparagine synthetase B family protein [Gelidibacter sp.]
MNHYKTSILPISQIFTNIEGKKELNLKAICVFAAIGFFLDEDTYWKNQVVLKAASNHRFDSNGYLISSKPWFNWHYTPRDITLNQVLDEFATLFETIIKEQSKDKKVIVPLSGGLDSRTQAIALHRFKADVFSYSYEFKNGYPETKIAKKIANSCDFEFQPYVIKEGYLWGVLDSLAQINGCYSDFTSARQMAIYKEYANMGDVFSLGHWGDVLFDSMNLPQLSKHEELEVLQKKLIKKGGLEFATALWNTWQLPGDFKSYLATRLEALLDTIDIEDTNAKLRAFKSKYWATRWTTANLSVFEAVKPIALPYYDNRMCEFICTVPEHYLKDRQIQIAYIQRYSPELAKIEWQDQRPFHLNNYKYNKPPYNFPYKLKNKIKRELKSIIGKPYVQRNWELQFLGKENHKHLQNQLLNTGLEQWLPQKVIQNYCNAFINNPHLNAHAINMLLVFSKFNQLYKNEQTH